MRLFLIRHAETVHNVGQIWAGTTDSPLTNHGMLQIQHLAKYFAASGIRFMHVFSSDLSRARITAAGLCSEASIEQVSSPIETPYLRERSFGSLEGVSWHSTARSRDGSSSTKTATSVVHDQPETVESMRARATAFVEEYLRPLMMGAAEETVAVVAHGVILSVLWECIAALFRPESIRIGVEARSHRVFGATVVVKPFWSNTGFMELMIERPVKSLTQASISPPLADWTLTVLAIDNKPHLRNLRRTGGGIGSASHDPRQQKIYRFFHPSPKT
ncbi:hypothetical protein VTN31DRAFT_7120 [Thermomyces dupontii]|uniref:uncharacterized protein n=1 Tax=Talaromyces thermophilus TaxID=28565 RepID=UPI003743BAD6